MPIRGLDLSSNQPTSFPWPAAVGWGAKFAIIRATAYTRPDPTYETHRSKARVAGLWTGAYAYIYPTKLVEQVDAFVARLHSDDELPACVDVEETGMNAELLSGWISAYKARTNHPLAIYTSAHLWHTLIGDFHHEFDQYPLWCADYAQATITSVPLKPSPTLPDIWDHAWIYQYAGDNGRIPGYNGRIDLNEIQMPIQPIVTHGSKLGIHSINPNQVVPLVKKAVSLGVTWPVVKIVNDASPFADNGGVPGIHSLSPKTITVCRYINPNPEWESLNNVGSWNQSKREQFAKDSIALILNRTPANQLAAVSCWGVENEPNPRDEPNGFLGFGLALIELVKEANAHGLKLALPAFPQGCPEWNAGPNALGGGMTEMLSTGLGQLVMEWGHIWDFHEGVFRGQPVDFGYGDIIPRAPYVAGAGSTNFRHRYFYEQLKALGQVAPLIVSEFYGGGYYPSAPSDHLARFQWYDLIAREEPYLLGFLPFTIDPDQTWQNENYQPTYDYQGTWDYLVAEKDKPNAETDMDIAKLLTQANLIHDTSAQMITELSTPPDGSPLYNAKALINLVIRTADGTATGNTLMKDAVVAVYAEHIPAGTFVDRAKINVDGTNVTMSSNGAATLQKV